jgi:hypothetical protein
MKTQESAMRPIVALCAALTATLPGEALAQPRAPNRAEVQVTARTDGGGAAGYCAMAFRIRNLGARRLSAFAAEIAATDIRTGARLTLPTTTIPFSGVEPGQTQEFSMAGAHGAPCEHVRLQVTAATCTTRCDAVTWTQQGLGAFEAAP